MEVATCACLSLAVPHPLRPPPIPLPQSPNALQLRAVMSSLRAMPLASGPGAPARSASALVEALSKQIAGIKEAGTYVPDTQGGGVRGGGGGGWGWGELWKGSVLLTLSGCFHSLGALSGEREHCASTVRALREPSASTAGVTILPS
jgi:hypothetical protein